MVMKSCTWLDDLEFIRLQLIGSILMYYALQRVDLDFKVNDKLFGDLKSIYKSERYKQNSLSIFGLNLWTDICYDFNWWECFTTAKAHLNSLIICINVPYHIKFRNDQFTNRIEVSKIKSKGEANTNLNDVM